MQVEVEIEEEEESALRRGGRGVRNWGARIPSEPCIRLESFGFRV